MLGTFVRAIVIFSDHFFTLPAAHQICFIADVAAAPPVSFSWQGMHRSTGLARDEQSTKPSIKQAKTQKLQRNCSAESLFRPGDDP
jgi:hypothetical protein